MASTRGDIMPFKSPHGQHGMADRQKLTNVTDIKIGTPVRIDSNGTLTASASPAVLGSGVWGIAMGINGYTGELNPETRAAYAAGDKIPVVLADSDAYFITKNYSAAGSAFGDVVPTVAASMGQDVRIIKIGAQWGVDISSNTNAVGRITDLLDAKRKSLNAGGGAAVYVVFKILGGQLSSDAATAPVTPAA
jgi:hypothetical protein